MILGLVAAVVAVFAWRLLTPREFTYRNKRLSVWLQELEYEGGDTNQPAFVALSQMGTNAIPPLLEIIGAPRSRYQKLIFKFNRRQSFLQLPDGQPWRRAGAASWALYAMGTNARPALPALTNLLFHTNGLFTGTTALAGMGPNGVQALIVGLTNQSDRIRLAAAVALGWARSDFDFVVGALIERLQDSNSTVHHAVVGSLGQLHMEPKLVVPALMKDFPGTDTLLRMGILTSLAQFGPEARESAPMIVEALKDQDGDVRESAAFALKEIDPAAAAKAGVK